MIIRKYIADNEDNEDNEINEDDKKEQIKDNNNNKIQNNNKITNVKPENIIDFSLIKAGIEQRTFVRLHPIPKKLSVYDI